MITTKRPNTDDYTQVGFIETKDNQGNYQNIDHIYDNQGNIIFQQGYLNEYQGADDFGIPAIGKPLIDYTIWGNTIQDGVPTPDNPIEPEFVGERTENLLEIVPEMKNKDNWPIIARYFSYYQLPDDIAEKLIKSGTVSGKTFLRTGGSYYSGLVFAITPFDDKATVDNRYRLIHNNGSTFDYTHDISSWENIYLCIGYGGIITPSNIQTLVDALFDNWDIMLVSGTTVPTGYEPYGYKIHISSAGQTKNIYLGQTTTTRKIKKLVLTGEEGIQEGGAYANTFIYKNNNISTAIMRVFSTHFEGTDTFPSASQRPKKVFVTNVPGYIYHDIAFGDWQFSGNVNAFNAWLAQQYAAGTPVTVWYVLAEPEVGIVNEPLCRIGDYADSVNFSQAGVEIPTLTKPNTTVIDVETTLEPSEVDVTYRGSAKPKYDLFLAKNGDSFEAKDGQSLYIGGNP